MKITRMHSVAGAVLVALMASMITAMSARADDVYEIVIKRQEERQKTRWSIADWLETRDQMRLQDLWLTLHSPSPYEFVISGNYLATTNLQFNGTYPISVDNPGWNADFAAYASIFGLEVQNESLYTDQFPATTRWFGIFDLRFFGFSQQSTNLTLQLGVKSENWGGDSFQQALAGISGALCFNRYFGVSGLYRYYFASSPSDFGQLPSGYRWEVGPFIDFSILRVQGGYLWETLTRQVQEAYGNSVLSGFQMGMKLFF